MLIGVNIREAKKNIMTTNCQTSASGRSDKIKLIIQMNQFKLLFRLKTR